MATKETLTQSSDNLAKLIDHTLLRANATSSDISRLCEEAKLHGFYSVCINPSFVALADELLMVSDVKVCTVVGFPLGANETQVKSFETQCAVEQGADEIDMVINIGALKDGKENLVRADIGAVVKASGNALVKVILETCVLTSEEIVIACKIAKEAGADFVKTSTGFNARGAAEEEVRIMREIVGESMGVKASGGIRDLSTFQKMVAAGASRVGTSSGVEIIEQFNGND